MTATNVETNSRAHAISQPSICAPMVTTAEHREAPDVAWPHHHVGLFMAFVKLCCLILHSFARINTSVLKTQTLPAGNFDSRPRSTRMLDDAHKPSWIFERMRLMSKDSGTTSGHGVRSWSFAPTLRLLDADVVAAADLATRLPRRGREHLEPPTRRDIRQNADGAFRAGAVEPAGADNGAEDATCGDDSTTRAGSADDTQATSIGAGETSRSIRGASASVGNGGLVGSEVWTGTAATAGTSSYTRPSSLSANRVEWQLLVLAERLVVPCAFA